MHILTLPRIGTGRHSDPFRPSFGDLTARLQKRPHGWGQAGRLQDASVVRAWVNCSPTELDRIAANPGASVVRAATAAQMRDGQRMIRSLRTEKAPRFGARWSARDEFVDLYMGPRPTKRPRRDARAEAFEIARRVAALIVLGAPLHVLMRLYASVPLDIRALLEVEDSDSFTQGGANPLNGLVMNGYAGGPGTHVWSVLAGGTNEQDGYVLFTTAGLAIDSSMSSVNDMRCTFESSHASSGFAAARIQDLDNHYYYGLSGFGGIMRLFKRVAASDTQLGSDGDTPGTSQALDCDGDSITGLDDAVADVGPVTDDEFSSGILGIGANGFEQFLSYIGEVEVIPPAAPNATYDEDVQPCEGADGTISPASNTGGPITSVVLVSGTVPDGYTLNADGTISKVGANMVAADIGSRTLVVDLTGPGGTQEDVEIPLSITANPPSGDWDDGVLVAHCRAPVEEVIVPFTDGGGAPVDVFTLLTPMTHVTVDADDGDVHLNPDRADWCAPRALLIQVESPGGQTATLSVSVEFGFEGVVNCNDGATWNVTMPFQVVPSSGGSGGAGPRGFFPWGGVPGWRR